MSVNALALKMIEKGLGFTSAKTLHHDLDHLSGSWSAEDEKTFTKNTKSFGKVDKSLRKASSSLISKNNHFVQAMFAQIPFLRVFHGRLS